MKSRRILLAGMLWVAVPVFAQTTQELYTAYIQLYYPIAQEQQRLYGVPACITLAQGLLESGAGRSPLAQKANNHFGIKCAGDWNGNTYHQDDDSKDECFRKYKRVADSYRDHALFLQRPRYNELFSLQVTDYKGWAHGLKRCGYATDPAYAGKLIKLIEDYNLMQYVTIEEQLPATDTTQASDKPDKSDKQSKSRKTGKPHSTTRKDTPAETTSAKGQSSALSMGTVDLFTEHTVLRNNTCKYVVAREGDTFQSIAAEFNIRLKAIYRYNDIRNTDYVLQKGDKVYLQMKRKKADKRYAIYRVRRNENIWQIAQDKAIQVETIYRLNGITQGQDVSINQELRLR